MGYFSKRKKQERIDTFLAVSLTAFILLAVLNFANIMSSLDIWIDNYRFQIQIALILFLIMTLFYRKVLASILTIVLILINSTIISSDANAFLPDKVEGDQNIHVSFHQGKTDFFEIMEVVDAPTNRIGTISLSPEQQATFINFTENGTVFTLANLDFSSIKSQERKMVFDNLTEFVIGQDNPLIIVGNFGIPAWAPEFKKFLIDTSLEVKNQVLLTNGHSKFNPFAVPTINLLAYRNVGIQSLEFFSATKDKPLTIEFNLNYN